MASKSSSPGAAALLLLCACWAAGAFASDAAAGTDAAASAGASAAADPAMQVGDGIHMSALRSWVGGLTVPIPANKTFELPMNFGGLTVAAGSSCEGLRVGDLVPKDNSSGEILEWDVYLSGVGISCHIEGNKDGDLTIDVVVASSSLHASVQVHPFYPEAAPDLPLPLGYFNTTSCTAEINIVDFNISGSSSLVPLIGMIDKAMLLPMMGGFINQPLCDGLQQLVEVNGTAALRTGAAFVEPLLFPPQVLSSPEPVGPVVDWGTYPPVVVIQALLHERFSIWANRMINILDFSVFQRKIVDTENVSLVMSDIFVDGLVTHQREPGLGLTTSGSSGSTLGLFANLNGLALQSTLLLEVALPDEPVLQEKFNVTIGLDNLSLAVRAFADKLALDSLAKDAARVMRSPGCLLKVTEGTSALQHDSIAFESMDAFLRPVFNVHSAKGDLEAESTALINTLVGSLYAGYFPTVSALTHGALGMAREPLNRWLWDRLEDVPPCASADLMLGLGDAASHGIIGAATAIFLVGVLAAGLTWWRDRREACREGQPETVETEASTDRMAAARQPTFRAEASLARQEFVPRPVAIFYPFALVGVMCLFLYADLQVGATVSVVMASEDQSTTIGPIFSFSLLSTVVHAWQSGAWVISFIAALTSGFWPFFKLSLLLATWLLPPRIMSTRTRGCILGFLNTWGKYSFVDCWFLVLTMSAFAIEWQSIGDAYLKSVTTPTAGFYVFFVSTGLSLILGHVASEYHTYADRLRHRVSEPVELAAAQLDEADVAASASASEPKLPAAGSAKEQEQHAHRHPHAAIALSAFTTSRHVRVAVACVLGASGVLMLVGTLLVSFDFEAGGILIDFLFGRDITKQYSLLSVGLAVTEGRSYDAGLLGLEVVFLVLAVVVPLVLLIELSVLWLVPMTLQRQEALLRMCYILDTWASLDVAVLVLLISDLQFSKLAEFLVYKGNLAAPCLMIKDLTRGECVQMDLTSRATSLVLVLAGLALLSVPKITMRLCARAIFAEARSPAGRKQATVAAEPAPSAAGKDEEAAEAAVVAREEVQDQRSPVSLH